MNDKKQQKLHVNPRILSEKLTHLKHTGFVPGNVYGLKQDSEPVSLKINDLSQYLKDEGETGLLYLMVGDNKDSQPVLFSEIQRHPVTNEVMHISFLRVNLKEKITQDVDVKLMGEFEVKDATVLLVRDSLEVEALPADLPDAFYIDISKLTEIGQEVFVKDLDYDRSKISIQLDETEMDEPIALVQEVVEEVEEEPVEVVEGEAAAEGEVTPEGEATPDGAQKPEPAVGDKTSE